MRPLSKRSIVAQLLNFLSFVAREFRLLYWVVSLSIGVLLFEYVATSLMIPLAAASDATDGMVMRFWRHAAELMGMPVTRQTWLWLFLVVMGLRLILGYVQVVSATLLGKRIHETLSGRIFRHVVSNEPLAAVYRRSVGYYVILAGDDTFRCGTIMSNLLQSIVGLSTALIALIVLYQFNQGIFLAIAAFLVLSGGITFMLLRHLLRLNSDANAQSRELGTYFIESLNSLRSIRSLHSQKFVQSTYAVQIATYVRLLLSIEAVKSGAKSFPAIALLLIAAVLFRPNTAVAIDDALLFGGTVIVIRLFTSLGQFIATATPLLTDLRAIRDIRDLTESARGDSEPVELPPSKVHVSKLAMNDVCFGYDSQSEVLSGVHFSCERGRTYAVIGPSGSGKSTLADVLLGLISPRRGTVSANDGSLPISHARTRVMLVEQQPKIFSATIRANLLLGTEASDAQIWSALRVVELERYFRALPRGLDTELVYLGENLSGGQRQRIGIARALIRDPDVLILDEATSALDPHTRATVVGNIRRRLNEGILIFITHDESIAKLADAVLQIGKHESQPSEEELALLAGRSP